MATLKGTSAGFILAEFLKARVEEKKDQLVSCNEQTFKTQQGRILELMELIKYIES
jgi:hypothetical protein